MPVASTTVPSAISQWVEQVRAGDVRAVSRAITAIENRTGEAENLCASFSRTREIRICIGITGAPGTGKSTLVDRLAAHYRAQKQTVGMIAVDPSSPYTGGAILGDRIRMQGHAADSGVFIRSMATRGFLGGLVASDRRCRSAARCRGKDICADRDGRRWPGRNRNCAPRRLHGRGARARTGRRRSEYESRPDGNRRHFRAEQSDREGADRLEQQLRAILQLVPERNGWKPPIVRTVATENKGIDDLARQIERFRAHFHGKTERRAKEIALWRERLLNLLRERLVRRVVDKLATDGTLESLAAEVAERKRDPYSAVNEMLDRAGLGGGR